MRDYRTLPRNSGGYYSLSSIVWVKFGLLLDNDSAKEYLLSKGYSIAKRAEGSTIIYNVIKV